MRLFILFSAIMLVSHFSVGQNPGYDVPKIEKLVTVPPSPEAQAFAKYGSTPVNLYTGAPEISIPIANLQGRELTIPVSLTYDASGIKVEQIATWVGLGWNLNAGGMVTRQINGNPDDYIDANPSLKTFYSSTISANYEFVNGFTATENVPAPAAGNLTQYFNFLNNATRSDIVAYKYEIEPDTYSFSALGISGTLYIDYTLGVAYCMEHPEIKAYPTFQDLNGGSIKNITGWRIVDGTGNAYYFELAERTYTYEQGASDVFKDYNSAWMLTRVESVNKRDMIQFNYSAPVQWQQPQLAGRGEMRAEVYEDGTACGNDLLIPAPVPLYKVSQVELTSIQVNGMALIQFVPSTVNRKDLAQRRFLSKIKLLDGNGSITKQFRFVRSYFGDSTQADEKLIRLRLDALETMGEGSLVAGERYEFSYEPGELPSRESMSQDFWGYFNGQNNPTLIPRNNYYDPVNVGFSGSNRIPDFSFGKRGSLIKIKYPTGGVTEFKFRSHASVSPVTSTTSPSVPGYASLTGGRDDNDPFGYIACDDNTNIPPKGMTVSFHIASSQSLNISIFASGSSSAGLQMQYVAVYGAGTGPKPLNPSFCTVLNGSVSKLVEYYGTLSPSTIDYGLFTFNPGYYRIMILNTNPNMTVTVMVSGTATNSVFEVGGQRIASIIDKDEYGTEVSARYFFYGDLTTKNPASLTRELLDNDPQRAGHVHASINFEEPRSTRKFDPVSKSFYTCESVMRYSSNRTKSNNMITYPIVSEIQFGAQLSNVHNGFSVSTFYDAGESYIHGYAKMSILNGRLTRKSVYDKSGVKLQEERNYYSQSSVGGKTGFVFYTNSSSGKDTYVVSEIYNPSLGEYFIKADMNIELQTHCAWDGSATSIFSDVGFHGPGGFACPQDGSIVNIAHPAVVLYQQLQSQGKNPTIMHGTITGLVGVYYAYYNVIYCRAFSSDYVKIPYLLPRYQPRTDSTVNVSYFGGDSIVNRITNTYDATTHYQVTLSNSTDSKGDVRQWQHYYPHDFQVSDPGDPAWQALIDQNRITTVVKTEAKYGTPLKVDYVKLTKFKSISTSSGIMLVPDVIRFSSGTGVMEDRIKYHQYDNWGNPSEISKVNDTRTVFIWDYSRTFPSAQIKNALTNEVFFTSFENEDGGNSTDAHAGKFSRTGGFSKLLEGLTPNKAYVLTYWLKLAGTWSLQTTNILASSSTSYNIDLLGHVDDVRFYPADAHMTTYTYRIGRGMTSTSDVNSILIGYEYDELGRLHVVRDYLGNILKQHKYHYRSGSSSGQGSN